MAIGDLSVFGGTGFVGSRFCSISTRKCIKIARDKRTPATEEILYFQIGLGGGARRDRTADLLHAMQALLPAEL